MATITYTKYYNEVEQFNEFMNEYPTKMGKPLHPAVVELAFYFIRRKIRGTVDLGGVAIKQFESFGDLLHSLRLSSDDYTDLQQVYNYITSDEYTYQYDRVLLTHHERAGLYSLVIVDDYAITEGDE